MTVYLIRRILLAVPTLIGITMVVFFVMAYSPGGIGGPQLDAEGATKADVRQAMRRYYDKRYHLKSPKIVQYLYWLNHVSPIGYRTDDDYNLTTFGFKAPNLGDSAVRRRPVSALFAEAVPLTLLLNVLTIPLTYGLSTVMGIFSAWRRKGAFDRVSSFVVLFFNSIPENWAGVMLIGFLASGAFIKLFPTNGVHDLSAETMNFLPSVTEGQWQRGWLIDCCWHLVLPLVCLTYGSFAFLTKLTRGAVLDNLSAEYTRTARAKGLLDRHVLTRHVVRNSIIPLITATAGVLPGLLGGSVIVESIFGIPGMGMLSVEAVFGRDRELIMATTLVGGILGLIARLIADIGYVIADPRVSYE